LRTVIYKKPNHYMDVDRESWAEKSLSQAFSVSNVGVMLARLLNESK